MVLDQVTPNDVLAGIDRDAVKRLIRGTYIGKYDNLRHGATEAAGWARSFGLYKGEPKRILDLGCGVGYFVRVCKLLGHHATGVDIPGHLHAKAAKLMEIDFIGHRMTTSDPLPAFDPAQFDLITLMHVSNHHGYPFYKALAQATHAALMSGGCFRIVFHYVNAHWSQPDRWREWFAPARSISRRGDREICMVKA